MFMIVSMMRVKEKIGMKWVFTMKEVSDCQFAPKARLVAKGYQDTDLKNNECA